MFHAVNTKTINKQKDGVQRYFDNQNQGKKCSIQQKRRKKSQKSKPVNQSMSKLKNYTAKISKIWTHFRTFYSYNSTSLQWKWYFFRNRFWWIVFTLSIFNKTVTSTSGRFDQPKSTGFLRNSWFQKRECSTEPRNCSRSTSNPFWYKNRI